MGTHLKFQPLGIMGTRFNFLPLDTMGTRLKFLRQCNKIPLENPYENPHEDLEDLSY